MKINWFPGHMTKTLKDIQEKLKNVDVIIYVLDARIPLSSLNPKLNSLAQNKPTLYVFNKSDMADKEKLQNITPKFKKEECDYVVLNSTLSGASKVIVTKAKILASAKIEKYKAKGIKPTIRCMVIGVPNSGKSTLVNNLCGKVKAVTGNRPGVTRVGQWLSIGDCIEIYDTPGTLYPNLQNQDIAKKLALLGSIKDEVVDTFELAQEGIKIMQKLYPENMQQRFPNCVNLEDIARHRGFFISKGELDIDRASSAFIDDLRKGRIGNITLD